MRLKIFIIIISMVKLAWFKVLVIAFSFFIIAVAFKLIFFSNNRVRSLNPDSCVFCHKNIKTVGRSHPIAFFGCASCHGGDRYSFNKKIAHKGMVLNPARLEYVDKYCGKCHSDVIERVNKSIMVTLRGVVGVLGEKFLGKGEYFSISEIKKMKPDLTINYYRKMCAACHVNQLQTIFRNKERVRGGGCVDCHGVKVNGNPHVILTTLIPSSNCLRCHNRSNRIGLAYFGEFQSAGYGTPYKNGRFSHVIRGGGRYYLKLHADIHWKKAKLQCVDCHSERGVMGDGYDHRRFEEQVVIQCIDCHKPQFGKPDKLADLLAQTNGKIKIKKDVEIAYTHKDFRPIYNLQMDKYGNIFFYRKLDGKKIRMKLLNDKPYHSLKIHKDVSCQACHSEWLPSCYGCHVAAFKDYKQYDWISHKPTMGAFREFSSFNRFTHPTLGIGWKGKVMPFGPGCQSFVSVFKGGKLIKQFHKIVLAAWDPHTTQLKSRSCEDCHFNPITLGLGRGNLHIIGDKIVFKPIFNSKLSGLPISYPLDAFLNVNGKQLQGTSYKGERAFNKDELEKIIAAYSCIICHSNYSDKIYKNFSKSKELFIKRKTPCSNY